MTAVTERPAVRDAGSTRDRATNERVTVTGRSTRNTAIQGLRAIAVLAVVGDHLVHRPSGGFVGVDVFFVISGFLITGLLLREIEQHGRIDLLGFYKRRIKRTIPLALCIVGLTLLVGSLILPSYRFAQLSDAALASSTFSINWQLISLGTDYLHATDLPTALQHFWSLAVEEQFYLVWPAILLVAVGIGLKVAGPGHARLVVGVIAALLTGLSAGWCVWQTASDPTAAYFSTASRAWELGIGATLAAMTPWLRRVPSRLAPMIGWAGFLALLAAFFLIGPDSAFPAPWAALPVLATAAIICGSEAGDAQLYPLTNSVSQRIGDLSYSLYLWHYPVVVFATAMLAPSLKAHLVEFVLMLALSALSYHLIENPLRLRSWRALVTRRSTVGAGVRPVPRISKRLVIAAGVATVITAVLLPTFANPTTAVAAPMDGLYDAKGAPAAVSASAADVRAAAAATSWPASVTDSLASAPSMLPAVWVKDGCLWTHYSTETPRQVEDRCTFGAASAPKHAVLYGDSIALTYYPALRRALASGEWQISVLTAEQCPTSAMTVSLDDGSPYPRCAQYRAWAEHRIAELHPDLLVTASSYSALWRWKGDAGAQTAADAWQRGAVSTLPALSRSAGQLLILDAPPMGPALRDCVTPIATPRDCAATISEPYVAAIRGERQAIETTGLRNVTSASTLLWYCTSEGICPSFVRGRPTLADGMHPSTADAGRIGSLIAATLKANPIKSDRSSTQ